MATRLILVGLIAAALAGCGSGVDPKADAAKKMKAASPEGTPKKPKSGDFD